MDFAIANRASDPARGPQRLRSDKTPVPRNVFVWRDIDTAVGKEKRGLAQKKTR